jgi:hypothetical protein
MIHALLLTANLLLADDTAAQAHATAAAHAATDNALNDSLGFAHDAAQFKFTATDDGGTIEFHAKDVADVETIAAIQKHLATIAGDFTKNDFSAAGLQGRVPDGIDTMDRLHESISYRYEALGDGGRVRLQTNDAEAVAAIRAFLKFQTVAYRAGNSSGE